MNHAKILASLVFAVVFAAGCSGYGTKAASLEDYNKARASAIVSLDKANKLKHEWRDSRKILEEADKAAKAGDYEQATKLANKARKQGDFAIIQANTQNNSSKNM